jgi:xanthine dehydrogenase molybdenum-binding subunit
MPAETLLLQQRSSLEYVGKDLLREDSFPKVRGSLRYVDDLKISGMLSGKVLRSPFPHAKIKQIDVSDALKLPGVVTVLTPFNVPQQRFTRHFTYVPWKEIRDRRILDSTVRFVGDPVAAVAATDPHIAEEAVEKIRVEFEELPAYLTAEASLQNDALPIHDVIEVGDEVRRLENNIPYVEVMEDGNKRQAYLESAKVYEETFKTQPLFNAPIEKRSIIASPTPAGGLEIWCTTQSIHGLRYCLSEALKIPLNMITVHDNLIGGGFGLKYNLAMHEPIAAYLAIVTGTPVKITMTREEDFTNGGRRPVRMDVKIGVATDGTIKAMEMNAVLQSGGYDDHIVGAVSCLGGWFFSMYRAKYKYYKGISVYTNLPVYSAMRGFLNPQQNFAVESLADEIAEDLGADPLEFRLKNIPRQGDHFYGQGFTVVTKIRSNGLDYLLREGARRIGWLSKIRPVTDGNKVRAIGFAWGHHSSGTGGEMMTVQDRIEGTGAIVKVNEDGSVNVTTGLVDHGGGTHEVFRKICAQTLGVRLDDIHITLGTTDSVPFDTGTHACRGSFVGGAGVMMAASEAKELLLKEASAMLEVSKSELEIKSGVISSKTNPQKKVTVASAVMHAKTRSGGGVLATSRVRPATAPPNYVTCFVEVELDKETGRVQVTRAVMGADVGTVVNPKDCILQLHGGVAFGMGMALLEGVQYDNGKITNPNYVDYMVARALDMPSIESFFADTYEPTGPFGLKGIGESSTNPVASAIANAVSRALGKRIRELPITPERILESMDLLLVSTKH